MHSQSHNPNHRGQARREKSIGWWEDYNCGCVSKTVIRKKDLLGYCGKHGDSRRQIFPDLVMPNTEVSKCPGV
jgi:hypothetical protein